MSIAKTLLGSIILCRFPVANPSEQDAKFRPTLVVDYNPQTHELQVVYGTSQHTERLDRGQIRFTPTEIPGLSKTTKFSLCSTAWLPVKPEYFFSKSTQTFQIIGRIPSHRYTDLLLAITEAGHKQGNQSFWVEFSHILAGSNFPMGYYSLIFGVIP